MLYRLFKSDFEDLPRIDSIPVAMAGVYGDREEHRVRIVFPFILEGCCVLVGMAWNHSLVICKVKSLIDDSITAEHWTVDGTYIVKRL